MSKEQKIHYVAKSNFGGYWAGMNQFTDQIRKAQFYNSIKAAKENLNYCIKKFNKSQPDEYKITSYTLIAVEIVELNTIEECIIT